MNPISGDGGNFMAAAPRFYPPGMDLLNEHSYVILFVMVPDDA